VAIGFENNVAEERAVGRFGEAGETGIIRGGAGLNDSDGEAFDILRREEALGESVIEAADADATADVMSVGDDVGNNAVGGVDGDGETDAGPGAGGGVDGGVDADESSGGIEERAAGVAGVNGGIDLDDVFDEASGFAGDGAVERGDDAGGESFVEAEGVADGEDGLSDLEVVAGADGKRGEFDGEGDVDLEDGEVVVCGEADEFGGVAGSVIKSDLRGGGGLNDVEVGDDVALLVPDEAGAGAFGDFGGAVGPRVDAAGFGGDENDGRGGVLEYFDGGFFVVHEVAARGDGARCGGGGEEPIAEEGPTVHGEDDGEEDGEEDHEASEAADVVEVGLVVGHGERS